MLLPCVRSARLGTPRATQGVDPMYPLNPDVMWQDMRYRRDRLLGVRRGHPWLASARERLTRRAAGEVPADPATTTVEVASTPSPEVVVPTQRQAGELGQGLRSR